MSLLVCVSFWVIESSTRAPRRTPLVSFVHLEFVLHEFSFVLHEFSLVKHECSFVLLEFVLHNAACLTWEIPAHRRKTYGGKDIVVIRGLNERAGAVPRDTQ